MSLKDKNDKTEFDFENLPAGSYTFTGSEGIVKLVVDEYKNQEWDCENWFSSLDPDKQGNNKEVIANIKKRLDPTTGQIKPIEDRKWWRFK